MHRQGLKVLPAHASGQLEKTNRNRSLQKGTFPLCSASIDSDGEYNDNPEWVANYVTLLESDATAESRNGSRGND